MGVDPAFCYKEAFMIYISKLLPLHLLKSFVEDLFCHLKCERTKMLTEPSLSIKHLKSSHIIKHLERFFHSKVFHMFRDIFEMIIIWIEFRILPVVSVSRVSRSTRSVWPSLVKISISIVSCSFLWIREDSVGLWKLSEFLFGHLFVIRIFVLR